MAPGSTQPLTEMSTRNLSWWSGRWCLWLSNLPSSCVDCLNILGASISWSSLGLSRIVQGYIFTFLVEQFRRKCMRKASQLVLISSLPPVHENIFSVTKVSSGSDVAYKYSCSFPYSSNKCPGTTCITYMSFLLETSTYILKNLFIFKHPKILVDSGVRIFKVIAV